MKKNPFIPKKKYFHHVTKQNSSFQNEINNYVTNQNEPITTYDFFPELEEPTSDKDLFLEHIGKTKKKYVLSCNNKRKLNNITLDNHSTNQPKVNNKGENTTNKKSTTLDKKSNNNYQELQKNALASNANLNESNTIFLDAVKDVTPLSGKAYTAVSRPTLTKSHCMYIGINPLHTNKKHIEFKVAKKEEYLEGHIEGFNIKILKQLQKGLFRPKATLDLHGFTIQQAFSKVVTFLHSAYLTEKQTVLVISGRGKNSPQGIPILKEKVYEWITQEPLKRVILAFCTAHACDGGSGAIYLLLRKYKKTWEIPWGQRPLDPDLI